MKISVNPFTSSENQYIHRSNQVLASIGSTRDLPGIKRAFIFPTSLFAARCDVAILHWVENTILDANGRISRLRVARLFLYLKLLKMVSKRLVMVRHNNYPHESNLEQLPLIKRYMDRYQQQFDVIVTHSGHNGGDGYAYVPHPLYTTISPAQPRLIEGEYFLVLGRVLHYKGIHKLIEALSPDVHVVIAGKTPDTAYLTKCHALAQGKKVTFLSGYVSDADAANLVTNAQGMIVPNPDEDMVVSGNYFFAFSYGAAIHTVQTPFTRWVNAEVNPGGLHEYPCIRTLASALTHSKVVERPNPGKIQAAFGDSAVARGWAEALAARR